MIKKLAQSIREYKKSSILSPVFITFEVILECIIPFLTAKMINVLENSKGIEDLKPLLAYGGLLIVCAFASLTCGVLAGNHCATAGAGFAKNLRHDLYYKVQEFSFTNIDRFSSSSLVTRLTTDITNVQMAYMMIVRIVIRAPLMMVFATTMAFTMCPRLSTIFVALIPILAFGLFLIVRNAMPLFRSVFKKYDNLNNSVQENVRGMRVVKAFVRESFETEKFSKASDDVAMDFTKAEKIVVLNGPLMQLMMNTSYILIAYFGAKLIVGGNAGMQVGQLSTLITYGVQILSSLMMLSMIFVMLTMAHTSAQRITEVLNEESTVKNPENPITVVENGDIEFNAVAFKYHEDAEKKALSNINLTIKSGETVGVLGGTGSSKTSLVQLIPRLYDATEGEVKVAGINVKEYDLTVLRDAVSFVLQKNELFSGTIKDNLRWGDKNASEEELVHACKLAQADEFIKTFPDGYDTYIEQGGTNVSGGQKQRLCIARALLKKPKILVLDDSTSAVDTKTDALIRKAFAEEIPDTTKIIIAQRVSSVQDADKIIIMDDGKISAIGTHEELLSSSEIYREVYYSQNGKEGDK